MKLTRAADFAIRLLGHLAEIEGVGKTSELAKKLDIPFNHLSKLVQTLSRHNFLTTRKGKGGGIKLAVHPKKIRLSDVVETIEGPMVLSECILNRQSCQFSKGCKFRKCLSKLKSQMYKVLSGTTVYDLVSVR